MDAQEEKSQRYRDSIDDGKIVRQQIDKLIASVGELRTTVGELRTSISGNDLGTEGLVDDVRDLRNQQNVFQDRLNKFEVKFNEIIVNEKAKARQTKLMYLLAGSAITGIIHEVVQHFFK